MEMNWILGAVLIALIVAISCLVALYMQLPKPAKDSEIRRFNEDLNSRIEALKLKLNFEEERGDHHSRSRDAAEKRLAELQAVFTKMIANASEVENLKALLGKCTCQKPTQAR